MWIASKEGFVSVVEHDDDDMKVRVRARTREHLVAWFPDREEDVIDFGEDASDYRWHLDVDRVVFADALIHTALAIDYKSHAKEAMSKGDSKFYGVLMAAWGVFMRLQRESKLPKLTSPQLSIEWDDGELDDEVDFVVNFWIDENPDWIDDEYEWDADAVGEELADRLEANGLWDYWEDTVRDENDLYDRAKYLTKKKLDASVHNSV